MTRWLETDTISGVDISTAATPVGAYTADAVRQIFAQFYTSCAGNGDYIFWMTLQVGGAGSEYLIQPRTTAAVASGVTAIAGQSTGINVLSGDILRIYIDGLAGDTSVSGAVRWFEMAALQPTTAGRTLDIEATGEAAVNVTLWKGADAGDAPLKPAVAGRTLAVDASGHASINWGDISNKGSVVNLTDTYITQAASVVTVTGQVNAKLASLNGFDLVVDTIASISGNTITLTQTFDAYNDQVYEGWMVLIEGFFVDPDPPYSNFDMKWQTKVVSHTDTTITVAEMPPQNLAAVVPGQTFYVYIVPFNVSGVEKQDVADALLLAPSGAAASGSAMDYLADILEDTGTTLPTAIADLPTAAEIDTELSGTHGDGSWEGEAAAGGGTGYYTDTVTDGASPLDGVQVQLYTAQDRVGLAYEAYTNALGVFEMWPDPGTYYRWLDLAGYSFTQDVEVEVTEP